MLLTYLLLHRLAADEAPASNFVDCRARQRLSGRRCQWIVNNASGITSNLIELREDRTKNGTPLIRRVLDTLPSTGKFVLNCTDKPFGDHSGAKKKVSPAIQPWTLHVLRRSFASGLQWHGIAPHIVELALNHRSGAFSGVAGMCERPSSSGRSTSRR